MAKREWPTTVDAGLREDLERLLREVGCRFQCEACGDGVSYLIQTRDDLQVPFSIELYPDQLNLNCGGMYLMIELAAHHPTLGKNLRAFDDWREKCLATVRAVLTSDIRVETRTVGGTVRGGYLWWRDGETWVPCGGGGDLLMFFGKKRLVEYSDWLAR